MLLSTIYIPIPWRPRGRTYPRNCHLDGVSPVKIHNLHVFRFKTIKFCDCAWAQRLALRHTSESSLIEKEQVDRGVEGTCIFTPKYLGNIVEIGPPSRIIERPLHPYTQALIESVPEPDPLNRLAERKVVPGEIPSSLNIPPGCQFHTRCPEAIPGLCNILKPQLSEIETDHETACHLYPR